MNADPDKLQFLANDPELLQYMEETGEHILLTVSYCIGIKLCHPTMCESRFCCGQKLIWHSEEQHSEYHRFTLILVTQKFRNYLIAPNSICARFNP